MKRLLSVALLGFALLNLLFTAPAWAGDAANGAQIFTTNCAACHAGGGNVVNSAKTLKKDVLEKYEMASIDAIKNQVLNGKNAMPAFKGRLNETQIEDVATYVLSQSEQGW